MRGMKRDRQFPIMYQLLNRTAVIRLACRFNNQLFQFIGFRLITSQVNEPLQWQKDGSRFPEPSAKILFNSSAKTLRSYTSASLVTSSSREKTVSD